MLTLNFISNSPAFYNWEVDWISYLFGDFKANHILDPSYTRIEENCILVLSGYMEGEEQRICNYVRSFRERGLPVGIVHLSDEAHTAPVSFYRDASFIFRNYYRPGVMEQPNCRYLPLGYRAGFTSNLVVKEINERRFTWSFAGALKQSRQTMLEYARRIPGGKDHLTDGAYQPTSGTQPLSVSDYAQLLNDTVFALSPRGNVSLDCFRLCEALEAGCIPIVEEAGGLNEWRDILWPPSFVRIGGWRRSVIARSYHHLFQRGYWRTAYGDFPCPTINHWQNLGGLLNSIDVKMTSDSIRTWWLAYKKELKVLIRSTVESHFIK